MWAIKTDTQKYLGCQAFIPILFTCTPEIDDWTYECGKFVPKKSGKYSVSYTVTMTSIGCLKSAAVKGTINDCEVIGSNCSLISLYSIVFTYIS